MKFIQIADGISVRKDQIISVERSQVTGTRITTIKDSYESDFPYSTILALLEMDTIEEALTKKQTPEPQDNLWGSQHWRG